jgi:hypothetical protein
MAASAVGCIVTERLLSVMGSTSPLFGTVFPVISGAGPHPDYSLGRLKRGLSGNREELVFLNRECW